MQPKSDTRLIILIRHGKAMPKNVGLSDEERILTETGRRECEKVGRALSRKAIRIDRCLSSHADRALETAHLFAPYLDYPIAKIQIVSTLYNSDTIQPIIKLLRGLDDDLRSLAVFGHNPSFEQLAGYFIPAFHAAISKGAAVGISFETKSWAELARASGRLLFMIAPSGLAVATSDRES